MPLPWRRDPAEFVVGLTNWAHATYGDDATLDNVATPATGMANETVLFRLNGEDLVGRVAPTPNSPFPTFPAFDLAFQRRCMQLVHDRTDVPVPEVVHLEESSAWLGAPFLVLRRVEGLVPSDNPPYVMDGWVIEGTAEQQARLEQTSIATLVGLHQAELGRADIDFLLADGPGATPLERQLGYQRNYYEWAHEGRRLSLVERAFEVLSTHMPNNARTTLNWGDSRIGNVIYSDFVPAAVLDWEMATVGPPEVDLGWMVFFHRVFQSIADRYGFAGLPDFLQRDASVKAYEEIAGFELDNLAWYEALAALRLAVISIRTSLRSAAYGLAEAPDDPNDSIIFAPLFEALLDEVQG
jgi:aminoglycoside phosphotransferase (APT) family kinase protein